MTENLRALYDSVVDIRQSIPNWLYNRLPTEKRAALELAMVNAKAELETPVPVDVTGVDTDGE